MRNAATITPCPYSGQGDCYQPLGSMPRCCSSLRSMRFIQVAKDESPSLRISSSSWARNSSGNRIWYCGDFFNSCIDTCNYPNYYLHCVITRVITFVLKSNEVPQVVTTPAGLLTNNIIGGNAMADANSSTFARHQNNPCPYSGQWGSYQSLSAAYKNFVGQYVLRPNLTRHCLALVDKKRLQLHATACYRFPAPYKTGVGIRTPKFFKATPDAESVFFVVRYMCHSMAWYVFRQCSYNRRSVALLAYHAANNGVMCSYRCAGSYPLAPMSTPRRQRMVALAGLPKGRPVSLKAGSSNPVNVTALYEIRTSSGDSLNNFKEAA